MSGAARSLAWTAIVLLALLGITSSAVRALAVTHRIALIDEEQEALIRAANPDPAVASRWMADLRAIDARFAAHPALTLLHVGPGALFFVLAPLQFSRRIRDRHIRFHRWSGRILVGSAVIGAPGAIYFGVLRPFAGKGEASSILLFGALMLLALAQGVIAVRKGDIARHREWMIRAFAVALGISTVRVVALALQRVIPMTVPAMMVTSFWSGWLLTVIAAEIWIRVTSTSSRTYTSPVPEFGSASR